MINDILKFKRLLNTGENRATKRTTENPVLLPKDVNFDVLAQELSTSDYVDSFFPQGISDFNQQHIPELIGKKKILLLHYVCIVAARRNPTEATEALNMLKQIWQKHHQIVSVELSLRWIVSTLQVFALCSKDSEERMIAYSGVTYGIMIKLYETERLIQNRPPDEKYKSRGPMIKIEDSDGLGTFRVGQQDIARNLNADLFYLSFQNDTVGTILRALLSRVATSKTIFSRLDKARIELASSHKAPNQLSFSTYLDS